MARAKLTPGVDDYDRHGNLKEPERFGYRDNGPKQNDYDYETTRNGAVKRTDWSNGYAVDVRVYRDDPECAWVYVSGGPDNIAIAEKMPAGQVKAFIAPYIKGAKQV